MPQVIAYRTALGEITAFATTNDWENDVQDASTGNFATNVNLTGTGTQPSSARINAAYVTGRSGAFGQIKRTFAEFSVPSEAQGNITAISLLFVPYIGSTGDVIIAKSTATTFANQYGTGNFSDYTTTAYSSTINPNGGSSPTWPTTSGTTDTFDITLNSTAISDANSNNLLKIVFMNFTHDFEVSEPSLGTNVSNGIRFINGTDDTYGTRMRLIIDYSAGYGNNVSGVASANIAKINGVATANIGKVLGVS
jgi:hypothetical protein